MSSAPFRPPRVRCDGIGFGGVRQWVLSLPFELRGLAATKPDVLTALGRIFAEEVARATKRLEAVASAETGSVSFPHGC